MINVDKYLGVLGTTLFQEFFGNLFVIFLIRVTAMILIKILLLYKTQVHAFLIELYLNTRGGRRELQVS
jgi:hypothetical protein